MFSIVFDHVKACASTTFTFSQKENFSDRKGIIPGNSKTLWHAVKIAKNLGTSQIPKIMTVNGVEISGHEIANSFSNFFDKKFNTIASSMKVDGNVYNGTKKMEAECEMFMSSFNIKECISKIKLNKTG